MRVHEVCALRLRARYALAQPVRRTYAKRSEGDSMWRSPDLGDWRWRSLSKGDTRRALGIAIKAYLMDI